MYQIRQLKKCAPLIIVVIVCSHNFYTIIAVLRRALIVYFTVTIVGKVSKCATGKEHGIVTLNLLI